MQKEQLKKELGARLDRFCDEMDRRCPAWDTAFFVSKVNQYYFTGTMQDGLFVVRKNRKSAYFVRRSFERARDESPLDTVSPMTGYLSAAAEIGAACGNAYFESEVVTLAILSRLKKHFTFTQILPLDRVIAAVRAVKSPFELSVMERAGRVHHDFLHDTVPSLLHEGMSEAAFGALLFENMVRCGYQGISRFSMFGTEMVVGELGFGESSLCPTSFDGPGGARGISPAAPILGSRARTLQKGDLVFVDIAFGMDGYHTDKTQVYRFGAEPTPEMAAAHARCMEVERACAAMLTPGAVPSEIYERMMGTLTDTFKQNFMGFGARAAKFLGHGVGLYVDEYPVIAKGFDEPLCENMTIALEPKKGIAGVGMVGVEDTFVVTKDGGRCLTGACAEIITVPAP